MTAAGAVAELERCRRTQFDPVVVDAFKAALAAGVITVPSTSFPAELAIPVSQFSLATPA
jgi:hypothetical protein